MPLINLTMKKGALTRAQSEDLARKLTDELLVIEGGDNEAARSIASVIFHEVEPENWAVGGRFDGAYVPPGGDFLTVINVPAAALYAEGKREQIASRVHAVLREVLGLPPEQGVHWLPGVIINEVPDGNWGTGGVIRHMSAIRAYVVGGKASFMAEPSQAKTPVTA